MRKDIMIRNIDHGEIQFGIVESFKNEIKTGEIDFDIELYLEEYGNTISGSMEVNWNDHDEEFTVYIDIVESDFESNGELDEWISNETSRIQNILNI